MILLYLLQTKHIKIYTDYNIRATQDTDTTVPLKDIEAREQHMFSPKKGFCVEVQWCTWG